MSEPRSDGVGGPVARARQRSRARTAAAACWAASVFVLVQVTLLVGNESVALQLGGPLSVAISPVGVIAGVGTGLVLAVACAGLILWTERGSPWASVVAGAVVGVIALVLGVMVVQQWSVGAAVAEAALAPGETTPAQSVLTIAVLVLGIGAVATPVVGVLRRRR